MSLLIYAKFNSELYFSTYTFKHFQLNKIEADYILQFEPSHSGRSGKQGFWQSPDLLTPKAVIQPEIKGPGSAVHPQGRLVMSEQHSLF